VHISVAVMQKQDVRMMTVEKLEIKGCSNFAVGNKNKLITIRTYLYILQQNDIFMSGKSQ